MKLEARGKYPGVKVHLDREECEAILQATPPSKGIPPGPQQRLTAFYFTLRGYLWDAIKKDPLLLEDRTEDQIKAELLAEKEKSEKKLALIAKGKDWKC